MPGEIMPATKVFVGRLSSDTSACDLRQLFARYGEVTECDVLGSYGFVHMKTSQQADDAIRRLAGHELHGSRITVEHSTGKKGRSRGGGAGGNGVSGGRYHQSGYNGNGGGGGGYGRSMRSVSGGGGGGGSGDHRGYRGPDRFSPYGRSPTTAAAVAGYGPPMDRPSYGGYVVDYHADRRAVSSRSMAAAGAVPAAVGYYDEYDRRDMYAGRAAPMPQMSSARYADSMVAAALPAYATHRSDPYSVPLSVSHAAANGGGGGGSSYDSRRDDYRHMYSRRSPPRYHTDTVSAGGRSSRDMGGGGSSYDRYDRYASPPRRVAPQHRELTAVRRY